MIFLNKQELHLGGKDNNVIIGAFVTCYGSMHLFNELFKLDDRVLYFDTDSIIFISKPHMYEPELADFLGKFTYEIKGNNYVKEFVSAGPKNYGYLLNNGKSVCKINFLFKNYSF